MKYQFIIGLTAKRFPHILGLCGIRVAGLLICLIGYVTTYTNIIVSIYIQHVLQLLYFKKYISYLTFIKLFNFIYSYCASATYWVHGVNINAVAGYFCKGFPFD